MGVKGNLASLLSLPLFVWLLKGIYLEGFLFFLSWYPLFVRVLKGLGGSNSSKRRPRIDLK